MFKCWHEVVFNILILFLNICRVHNNIFIFIPNITYLWYSPTTVIFLASFFFFLSVLVVFSENQIFDFCWLFYCIFFPFCWFLLLSLPFSFFCCFLEGWLIAGLFVFFPKGFLNRSLSFIFIFYAFPIYKFKSIHFSLSMVLAVSHYDSFKNIL